MPDQIVTPLANRERAILQALQTSGVQGIALTYDDLANSVAAVNQIADLRTRAVLLKLLKALAMVYLELERGQREA